MTDKLPDVWAARDYPVLLEVVRRIDAGGYGVNGDDIAEAVGISEQDVENAARALERRGLVTCTWFMGSGLPSFDDVTGEAYFLTGLHPSGDDQVSAFVAALRQAADLVEDPAEKSRLRALADGALGLSRDVLGGVLTAVATGAAGIGG